MARNQVGARTEGDVYQGLFFWLKAAELLLPNSNVERVVLEYDKAEGVDDVAVFYCQPGVNAGGHMVTADYFQLKYHVDNRDSYCSDALIDPKFINAKTSLLQRFYKAYSKLVVDHDSFRLYLTSNWNWIDKNDDKLFPLIREYDGELPSKFFDDGPGGDLGKIREKWRAHLKLDDEVFRLFAKTLRFHLNEFGRRRFKDNVYKTLMLAGLRIPSADRAACPYDSLIQQFLMNGPNCFDKESLQELCMRENLLSEASPHKEPVPIKLGIRSFMRSAERLETEVDEKELICVSENFEGRHLVKDGSWSACASKVRDFLADPDRLSRLRAIPSTIALECHGSLALLTGWELSRNSGVDIAPIQKPSLAIWKPSVDAGCNDSWDTEVIERSGDCEDIAVCLSVTHDVRRDVEKFLAMEGAPAVSRLVLIRPQEGTSPQSIKGPDHAYHLASQLPAIIATTRPSRAVRAHIFFACPNALMFFIGQQREALGRLALYELDFGLERDGSYHLSFILPLQTSMSPNGNTHEVKNDPEDRLRDLS